MSQSYDSKVTVNVITLTYWLVSTKKNFVLNVALFKVM
jgi:hypothetical protein